MPHLGPTSISQAPRPPQFIALSMEELCSLFLFDNFMQLVLNASVKIDPNKDTSVFTFPIVSLKFNT